MAEDLTRRTAGCGRFSAVAGGGTDGCVPAAKRAVMPSYTTFFVSNMRLKLPLRQQTTLIAIARFPRASQMGQFL